MPNTETLLDRFVGLAREWTGMLEGVGADGPVDARTLLVRSLADSESREDFATARNVVTALAEQAGRVNRLGERLSRALEVVEAEWHGAHRFTPDGVRWTEGELAALAPERPAEAARYWLSEIVRALDLAETEAIPQLLAAVPTLPDEFAAGVETVQQALGEDADETARVALLDAIADDRIEGWPGALPDPLRTQACRIAAWIYGHRLGDLDAAAGRLDAGLKSIPSGIASLYSERAALRADRGAIERAMRDARRAIAAGSPARGYLALGACAELRGDYAEADRLYEKALNRMQAHEIVWMRRRATLATPSGRLLVRASQRLLSLDHPRAAVDLADAALAIGVKGTSTYPEASAYRLRSLALEQIHGPEHHEVARSALEAGRRFLRDSEPEAAIDQLRRALVLDGYDTGWLLADALVTSAAAGRRDDPDHTQVEDARRAWDEWADRCGSPSGPASWAYLTRAYIADDESKRLGAGSERRRALWEALGYAERALAHDDLNALRWTTAARYLRMLDLDELALEAVGRARDLSPSSYTNLVEWLTLLANRGKLEEADDIGSRIEAVHGQTGWVSAVRAWIAHQQRREQDALKLLEIALSDTYDPGWYWPLRALCHLGLHDWDEAADDFREIRRRGVPASGYGRCFVAIAEVVLGDRERALELLAAAEADESAPRDEYLQAAAIAAYAEGDLDRGGALLRESVAQAPSRRALESTVRDAQLLLSMLDRDAEGRLQAAARAATEEVAETRRREVERDVHDADAELERALAEAHGESGAALTLQATVLFAVRARRLAAGGDLEESARTYLQLIGTEFEPEARVAARRALDQLTSQRADAGDVEGVRRVRALLRELSADDTVTGATAVATALAASDRGTARRFLAETLPQIEGADAREEIHERIADIAVRGGDLEAARSSLAAALDSATGRGDRRRIAQVRTRLVLAELARGNRDAAVSALRSALSAWEDTQVTDPPEILAQELRALLGHLPTAEASAAADLFDEALRAVAPGQTNGPETAVPPAS
jgi:tetratricopeptide (TPR) repeat protein